MSKKSVKKYNRNIYTLIAVLIIIIMAAVLVVIIKATNQPQKQPQILDDIEVATYEEARVKHEAEVSEIEEGSLPTAEELSALDLENVMQVSHITEQFNLNNYEELEGGIKYNYLANAVTSSERLSLYARAMTEEEYEEMLPTAKVQEDTVNDIDVVFNNRNLYYTSEDKELSQTIINAEETGNIVIRYGNSTSEFLPMQQLMWYHNGIGYTLESINREYTIEDIEKLAEDFFSQVM